MDSLKEFIKTDDVQFYWTCFNSVYGCYKLFPRFGKGEDHEGLSVLVTSLAVDLPSFIFKFPELELDSESVCICASDMILCVFLSNDKVTKNCDISDLHCINRLSVTYVPNKQVQTEPFHYPHTLFPIAISIASPYMYKETENNFFYRSFKGISAVMNSSNLFTSYIYLIELVP